MNRKKRLRHQALAVKIHDRHNPPYRVVSDHRDTFHPAATRDEARDIKRLLAAQDECVGLRIEQRDKSGYGYQFIR